MSLARRVWKSLGALSTVFVISVISDGVEFMPAVIGFMHSDKVLLFVCLESVESGRGIRTFELKVQIVQFLIFFSLWIGNIWILFIAFVSSFNCYTCLVVSIVCESKSTSKSFPITSTTNSRQQPPGCAIRQKKPTFFFFFCAYTYYILYSLRLESSCCSVGPGPTSANLGIEKKKKVLY